MLVGPIPLRVLERCPGKRIFDFRFPLKPQRLAGHYQITKGGEGTLGQYWNVVSRNSGRTHRRLAEARWTQDDPPYAPLSSTGEPSRDAFGS